MLDRLTVDSFSPLLGQVFTLRDAVDNKVDVQLIEAEKASKGSAGRRDPFSLIFRVPGGVRVSQGNFRVHNQSLGELEFFMVPFQPDSEGMRLQAVFN